MNSHCLEVERARFKGKEYRARMVFSRKPISLHTLKKIWWERQDENKEVITWLLIFFFWIFHMPWASFISTLKYNSGSQTKHSVPRFSPILWTQTLGSDKALKWTMVHTGLMFSHLPFLYVAYSNIAKPKASSGPILATYLGVCSPEAAYASRLNRLTQDT